MNAATRAAVSLVLTEKEIARSRGVEPRAIQVDPMVYHHIRSDPSLMGYVPGSIDRFAGVRLCPVPNTPLLARYERPVLYEVVSWRVSKEKLVVRFLVNEADKTVAVPLPDCPRHDEELRSVVAHVIWGEMLKAGYCGEQPDIEFPYANEETTHTARQGAPS